MCAGLMCLGLFWRGVVGFFSLQITLVGSWQLQPCESGLELAAWLPCQQQQHAMLLPMLMLTLTLTLLMMLLNYLCAEHHLHHHSQRGKVHRAAAVHEVDGEDLASSTTRLHCHLASSCCLYPNYPAHIQRDRHRQTHKRTCTYTHTDRHIESVTDMCMQ